MIENRYEELVGRAEKAVAAVKDPELRRVAFEKILDDLLRGGSSSSTSNALEAGAARVRKRPASKEMKTRKRPRGPKGYIQELIAEAFFDKPKTISEVKAALENLGHHIPLTSLSNPLARLCQDRELRRQKTGSKGSGKKQTFSYSKW